MAMLVVGCLKLARAGTMNLKQQKGAKDKKVGMVIELKGQQAYMLWYKQPRRRKVDAAAMSSHSAYQFGPSPIASATSALI